MEKIIEIKLTDSEFRLIMGSLTELPFKLSAGLLDKLQQQYRSQQEVPKPIEAVPKS